jgi:hypothetical protein
VNRSAPDLLVLHALRLAGMADEVKVARRHALDPGLVEDLLLDHEAAGLVTRVGFAGLTGWALTERGKAEGERLAAAELDATGARPVVTAVHDDFVPLNARLLGAMSRWQVRPATGDPMAANDHTDWAWDEQVLRTLSNLSVALRGLEERLVTVLLRFGGYTDRFAAALGQVDRGQRRYVDEPGLDSAHTVWFQLHEDLLATLHLSR